MIVDQRQGVAIKDLLDAFLSQEVVGKTEFDGAGRIQPLVDFYSTPGICDERMFVLVATDLTAGTAAPEPQEDIRLCPMKYAEALEAVRDGRIRDAKSLVGLLYYDRFRRDA